MSPPATQPRTAISLREASFDDYQKISALGERHGLKARVLPEWRHLWLDNPEYKRHRNWPIGWVLETGSGALVGSILNVPVAYTFRGKTLSAAAGRCWVTEPEYRTFAMLLLDEYFQQNVNLYLNTTVNRQAAEAYRMFESPPVPKGSWDHSQFWIANYRGFARSALAAKGAKLAALATFPLAMALCIRDIGKLSVPGGRGIDVKLEHGFDARFDRFWERLREYKRDLLLGVRTAEALEWHFRFHMQRKQVYILTVSGKDGLLAYTIFYRKDKEDFGLKRVRLVDYQSLSEDPAPLAAMLSRMLKICRAEKIHMLEDVGCSLEAVRAPHQRKLPSWLYYYKADESFAEPLSNPACWQPSLFDGDSSL